MKTLALIGVGKWGKNILRTLEKIPEVNLKYLCANNIESLAKYPAKYEKLSDWRKLLKKKDLDAVFIATPASTHAEIAIGILSHGLAVFMEKPMVLSMSEAEQLSTAVKKSGKIFMVGYQYVFNDYVRFIKKEIENDAFGKISAIKSEQIIIPPSTDTDVFTDAAHHPLSIFQFFFGLQKLEVVKGEISHDDARVHVFFESSPSFEIVTSTFGEKRVRRLTIAGEKATAVLDETLEKNKLAIIRNGQTLYPEIDAKEPLRNELEHFLHCLKNNETPLTNVDFGLKITEWLEKISKKLK